DADVIFGTDNSGDVNDDTISVTVIATGLISIEEQKQQEKPKVPNMFAGGMGGMAGGLNFGNQGVLGAGGMSSLSGMRPITPQTDSVQVLGTGGTANLSHQGGSGVTQTPAGRPAPATPTEPVTISRVEPKSINIPDFLKRH
ncbi:MAG: hypothetical protein IJ075_06565, partial [Lachnospiraceae bacterium]|nr:hypothetical protein [Lachnospiraceae bacterium]